SSRSDQTDGVVPSVVVVLHICLRTVSGTVGRGTWLARVPAAAPPEQTLSLNREHDRRTHLGGVAYQHVLLASVFVSLIHSERGRPERSNDGAVPAHTGKRSARDCDAWKWLAGERHRKDLVPHRRGAAGLDSCRDPDCRCGDRRRDNW